MEPHISRTVGFSLKTCKDFAHLLYKEFSLSKVAFTLDKNKHEVTFRHGFTQGTVIVHLFEVSEMQFLHWT